MYKKVFIILLIVMCSPMLLICQEKSYPVIIQKIWKELSTTKQNEIRFSAYDGNEIAESAYRLHSFRENKTIFTSTHYSNKEVKSAGLGFSDKDETFIEESKWEIKGADLIWYVRSSKFGLDSSTATTFTYKIIKLSSTEMILKLIDTKTTTL